MKSVFKPTQLLIILGLLVASCNRAASPNSGGIDTPTFTPTATSTFTPTVTATPTATLTPVPLVYSPHPLTFPSNALYIAVDESRSMSRETSGECDPDRYRYQIPLYLMRLYQDLIQKSLPIQSTLNLAYMAGSIEVNADIQKIIDGLNDKVKYINQPLQFPTILFQALFQHSSFSTQNQDIVIFTDGDFREDLAENPDINQQTQVSISLNAMLQNPKTKDSRIFVVLLCVGKLDLQQIDWWRGVDLKPNTWVYGIDSTTAIENVVEELLIGLLSPEMPVQEPVLRSGWKLVAADDFVSIPKDSLHVFWGASEILKYKDVIPSPVRAKWNNGTSLPDQFSDLWPRADCKDHALRVIPDKGIKLAFVWWHTQPLGFSTALSSDPVYIYNNAQQTLQVSRRVLDNGKPVDDSSVIDWQILDKCLPPKLIVDNAPGVFPAETSGNKNVNFSIHNLPEGYDAYSLSVKLIVGNQDFVAGQLFRRYFPVFDDTVEIKLNIKKSAPSPGVERHDVTIDIPYKYLSENYYPAIGWMPRISFSDGSGNCVLMDTYLPGKGQDTGIVYIDPVVDNLVRVHLNNVTDATRKCTAMKISWNETSWGRDGWMRPDDTMCSLTWSKDEGVDKIDCQTGD